jgi:quercetin dioxygenase-like cupin family protein
MKTTTKLMLVTVAAGGLVCAISWATPILNLASPLLATGTIKEAIKAFGTAPTGNFAAAIATTGPATVLIQDGAYTSNGINGWHSHAGVLAITLVAGSIEWYDENCNAKSYKAGDSWTEGSAIHAFKVTSTTNIHLLTAFIIAPGSATRIDEPAPACAANLGLQ